MATGVACGTVEATCAAGGWKESWDARSLEAGVGLANRLGTRVLERLGVRGPVMLGVRTPETLGVCFPDKGRSALACADTAAEASRASP